MIAEPVRAYLGISTSGNWRNVVMAFEQARTQGLRTIALTGRSNGKLAPLADIEIKVPSDETSPSKKRTSRSAS